MTPDDIKKENANIAKEYKELLSISYRRLTAADKKLIRKAKTQLEVQAWVTTLLQAEPLYATPNMFKPDGTHPEFAPDIPEPPTEP